MKYRTFKTTMGHRYKVAMDRDELAERELYWIAVTVLPFVSAALMTFLWITGVRI